MSTPVFTIVARGGNVFIPDQDQGVTGIALEIQVRNAGLPSIAVDWAMSLVIPGESHPIKAQLTHPPARLTLHGPAGTRVLTESDFSLELAASKTPLRVNDPPVQGWLLFYVELPKSKVMNPQTIIEVSANDYMGARFSTRQTMGDWMRR